MKPRKPAINNRPHTRESSSFRDPSGFVFRYQGHLYRQINRSFQADWELFNQSGLYSHLVKLNWLVPHQVTSLKPVTPEGFLVIKPQIIIPFLSYIYEWSFSQLKAAALLTLKLQTEALKYNLTLKDASAYNIQFYQGKPILIDKLSFIKYNEGEPWIAYRQFCQHFLAPLSLMTYTDTRLGKLSRLYLDGIPLDLTSQLLPKKTYLNPGLFTHIHLHAKSQAKYAASKLPSKPLYVSRQAIMGLVDNLTATVKKLQWHYQPTQTEWGNYYQFTNYTNQAQQAKYQTLQTWIKDLSPRMVWDLGANDGRFSRIATQLKIPTIAFDIDPVSVEENFHSSQKAKDIFMLPLQLDLTNPSPSIGWENTERLSIIDRGPVDLVMALALIHHLVISNNIPFNRLTTFLSHITRHVILEFVPKSDSQVQKLLATRTDIFPDYDLEHVIDTMSANFKLVHTQPLPNSSRTLLLFSKKIK